MKPVVVLQTRRLGDIILTFPLIQDLLETGAPVIMVAEPAFYEGLIPFAPGATFFPTARINELAGGDYAAVYNLSPDPRASVFAARARAEKKFGYLRDGDRLSALGFWHLYRASLTRNNRHNIFHWADLFRLDNCIDRGLPLAERAPAVEKPPGNGKIGLFVGASEASKRPDAPFWIDLHRRLRARGLAPVILGGPGERETGAIIAAQIRGPTLNFAGKTTLPQLASIIKSLDLLITPDTGPMHLAGWLGAPILNLSMGNVCAAETGPTSPGQRTVRAAMSCYGCWSCSRGKAYCKKTFTGAAIARVAEEILAGREPARIPGQSLILRTVRDEETGLIEFRGSRPAPLDRFWRGAFLDLAGLRPLDPRLAAALPPRLVPAMRLSLAALLADLAPVAKNGSPLTDDFWSARPFHSRLFAGFLHMRLQNSSWSRPAYLQSLEWIERLDSYLARSGS